VLKFLLVAALCVGLFVTAGFVQFEPAPTPVPAQGGSAAPERGPETEAAATSQTVNVRWAPSMTSPVRAELERAFRLTDGERLDDRTWRYTLNDLSASNRKAIVASPHVEDTHNIVRQATGTDEAEDQGAAPPAGAEVHVRWAPEVTSGSRSELERRFSLTNGEALPRNTWRYWLTDTSKTNVAALVDDPAVEDTAKIDRQRYEVER
jgi:hypothetical protein